MPPTEPQAPPLSKLEWVIVTLALAPCGYWLIRTYPKNLLEPFGPWVLIGVLVWLCFRWLKKTFPDRPTRWIQLRLIPPMRSRLKWLLVLVAIELLLTAWQTLFDGRELWSGLLLSLILLPFTLLCDWFMSGGLGNSTSAASRREQRRRRQLSR